MQLEAQRWRLIVRDDIPEIGGWLIMELTRDPRDAPAVMLAAARTPWFSGIELAPLLREALPSGKVVTRADTERAGPWLKQERDHQRTGMEPDDDLRWLNYTVSKIGFAAKPPPRSGWRTSARIAINLFVDEMSGSRKRLYFRAQTQPLKLKAAEKTP